MTLPQETLLHDIPEKSRRDFPRIVNRLLGQTFLYQDVDRDKDDYYFVHRHRAIFESVLALTGFNLLHDDYHRIFQVVSEYSYSRARYKLDESLMIVVLRKLYEDKTEHLSLANDPVVTIGEVREEYRTITGKERDLGIGQYETLCAACAPWDLSIPLTDAVSMCATPKPACGCVVPSGSFSLSNLPPNWKRG